MCKSPSAATRSLSGLPSTSLILSSDNVRKSQLGNIDRVIRYRKHAPATHFHLRGWQLELVLQTGNQFMHQPAWNLFSLGRVNESEVQQVDQQDFPILLHRRQQALPIDFLMLDQYEMGNIGAIVALAVLNEDLGPDQVCNRGNLHFAIEEFGVMGVFEPIIGNWGNKIGRTKDEIDVQFPFEDFRDPTLVLHLGLE